MKLYEFFSVPSLEKEEEGQLEKMTGSNRERLSNDLFWYILDNDKIHLNLIYYCIVFYVNVQYSILFK